MSRLSQIFSLLRTQLRMPPSLLHGAHREQPQQPLLLPGPFLPGPRVGPSTLPISVFFLRTCLAMLLLPPLPTFLLLWCHPLSAHVPNRRPSAESPHIDLAIFLLDQSSKKHPCLHL